ncbi:DNA polymerase V [Escherichia coli]|nr:DNA polymerase V [Escherichia coli]
MKFIPAVSEASIVKIPLFTERCPAGFPSPAADYTESEPRQPGGCKLKTAPVRPVVAARPAEYVCSENHGSLAAAN